MAEKVIVALSGGVDSSVSAALLLEQGYEVEGVFMKNWSPDTLQSLTDCPWQQDLEDAAAVCQKLGIPFRSVNFEREYREKVVDYFLREYSAGRTPNPDIMCNKEIKFKLFLRFAEEAGAARMATGHYVRTERGKLYRGADPGKDQSYFLYTLSRDQLEKILFPVGDMLKKEVREAARRFGLPTAEKKDSQGICFIGQIDFKRFLQDEVKGIPGEVLLLPESKEPYGRRIGKAVSIGRHPGIAFYTLGERAGGIVDNRMFRKATAETTVPPLYVVGKDKAENRLYVSRRHDDSDLWSRTLVLEECSHEGVFEGVSCQVRYRQEEVLQVIKLEIESGGRTRVTLSDPAWAAAPGQSAVFYAGERVVGGGVIAEAIPLSEEVA